MSSKKPRTPAASTPAEADAPTSTSDAARAPRLGDVVLWSPPSELRRVDVREQLGVEVPAVIARLHDDGSADLHPLLPLGAPAFRVELTWRVRRDDNRAPGTWRPRED